MVVVNLFRGYNFVRWWFHGILVSLLKWCFGGFSPSDEKERFDPTQFQDCIIQGLTETGTDLEAVAKFLDASGAKLDYRRYAETLFDILVAGGMLGKWVLWEVCCMEKIVRIQNTNCLTNLSNWVGISSECDLSKLRCAILKT